MDLSINNWIIEYLHHPFLDWLMPIITALGNHGFIWILASVILLIPKKTRRWGIMCAVSLGLTFLFGELFLKNLVERARPFTHLPELTLLIPAPISYSFPSGHAASSFSAAVVLFFMSRKGGVWALILAVLIGFSRVYLSVHYLTDVLAGAALGIACAYTARWILERYNRDRRS